MVHTFITETDPITISVTIGKSGSSVAAWAHAISELLNIVIATTGIDTAISILENITTQHISLNDNGVQVRSTPEAIAFALIEYRRMKQKEERKRM